MSICERYTNNQDDALEILNDGYLKIFKEIHRFQPSYSDATSSFKGWLRKIMVCTAIDHFRKQRRHDVFDMLDSSAKHFAADMSDACDKISFDEIIRFIQHLSPAYRTVFNLFIIEGFSHEDIARHLGISIGTSKSNLAKARKQIQKILFHQDIIPEYKLSMKNAG